MKKFTFSLLALLFGASIITHAQVSFITNGQQINNLQGNDVEFGDFNADGNLDAFVVNISSSSGRGHRVYLNDSTGHFTDNGQQLIDSTSNQYNAAVGDIDNDGKLEVITGSTIWLNDGNGLFEADSEKIEMGVASSWGVVVELADLNNDNYLDLFCVIVNLTSSIKIYLNDSTGHFHNTGQLLGGGTMVKAELGDVDGDGDIDAVTAGWKSNTVDPLGTGYCPNRVWINDGDGHFTDVNQVFDEGSRHLHDLKLGDVNNDGHLDMVMGITSSPYLKVFTNNGTGTFTASQSFGSRWVSSFDLGDLDNNGTLDLFFVSGDCSVLPTSLPGQIWLNDGMGQFAFSNVQVGNAISSDVKLADLNNDSRLDAFVVNWGWDGEKQIGKPADIWLNNTFICDYFGQTPPGDSAVLFAPGIISLPDRNEGNIAFSPDGKECYFSVSEPDNTEKIYYTKWVNNNWTAQEVAPFSVNHNFGGPIFSLDGNKLFFYDHNAQNSMDIWKVERDAGGWGEPQIMASPINSDSYDFSYIETADSTIYFNSNRSGSLSNSIDIWYIRPSSNQAINLGLPVNSVSGEICVCVSPDGSYLIFSSDRSGGIGEQDLYICFNKGNNEWTDPINMERGGTNINITGQHQNSPTLSPDGKYLFFGRHTPQTEEFKYDPYWVSTHIIDTLKTIAFISPVIDVPETENAITIFPNPVEGVFTIALATNQDMSATAEIFNTEGKMVLKQTLHNPTSTIDLSGYPAGLYFLNVNTGSAIANEKIIKQ